MDSRILILSFTFAVCFEFQFFIWNVKTHKSTLFWSKWLKNLPIDTNADS